MTWSVLATVVAALVIDASLASGAAAAGLSATAITTGSGHNCALITDRTVRCWGGNPYGQLGDGTRTTRRTPVAVRGLSNVLAVSAASTQTCALVDGGGGGAGPVECWGAGRSGDNFEPTIASLVPVPIAGITDAIGVAAGSGFACALLADHTVSCWGDNFRGQLGNGTRDGSATPVRVPGLDGVQSVDIGDSNVCVVMQDGGAVRCWGWSGRLGPVDQAGDALVPTAVPGVAGATSVDADPFNDCALLEGGVPKCWSSFAPTPAAVSSLAGVKAYSWSMDGQQTEHSCALLAGGTVRCRSRNPYQGQIGNGTTKPNGNRFVTVSGLRDVTAISAASFYTCALRATGSVACWGSNTNGVLGDGTTTMRTRPVTVKGLTGRAPSPPPVAAPVFGKSTTLKAVSGSVRVRLPGAKRFVALDAATTVPVGATIDATGGRLRLTTAKDLTGQTQSGLFDSGVFRVTQTTERAPTGAGQPVGLTVLTLAGPLPACKVGATAARKRRHGGSRRLWGNAKGNYRSVGRYAAATVRGTRWLTQDTCTGTVVQVARGAVSVNDLTRHRTVLVRAPGRYLARAR